MSTSSVQPTALIAVVLLTAACGGDTGSESASASAPRQAAKANAKPAVDVCALLTREEIAAVTKAQVTKSDPATYGPTQTCNYTVGEQLMPVVSVLLSPNIRNFTGSKEMAEWRSKQAKEGMSMGDIKVIIEPVEGLGVPAIRNEIEGAGMVTVETAAKGRLLDVTTSSLVWSKALVAKAMVRLP